LISIAFLASYSTMARERTETALPEASIVTITESRQSPDRTLDLPQARVPDTDFRMLVGDQSAGN